ncbi:30S ribosomal protein S17 [bacterium]|nr:MAG: 30S ribosomal protein S17 [bacterium]
MKQKKQIENKLHKQLKGKIVSDKMNETAVIKVTVFKKHPIYKKRYKKSKKYLAHNINNQFKTGNEVVIESMRPLSKRKCWMIKRLVTNDNSKSKPKDVKV